MTYAAIKLKYGDADWHDVPALPADTDIMVVGGEVWLSDDIAPSSDTAFTLVSSDAPYFVRAGRAMKVRHRSGGLVSVRRMDSQ